MKKKNVMKRVWQIMSGLVFVLGMICLTGCPGEAPETIRISASSLDFSSSGGEKTFTIASKISWTVSSSDTTWITVSPSSGSDNGTVTVTVAKNDSLTQRSATLTVSGNEINNTINVTQAGTPVSLIVSVNSLSFPSASSFMTTTDSYRSFTVTSNTNWTVSSNETSWLTVSPASGSKNSTINVTAIENNSLSERTAIITVSAGDSTQTVNVTQAAANEVVSAWIESSSSTHYGGNQLSFSESSGHATIRVTSNLNWIANNPASWITISPTSGSNNGTRTTQIVEITVAANTSASERSATITFSGGDKTASVYVNQKGFISNLTVSPGSLRFSSASAQESFSITSNINWTVSRGTSSWLSVSPTSGSNNGTISVTASANNSASQRTATITVNGGDITRTINVTQSGNRGDIMFWISKDFDCGWISVTLSGQGTRSITGYYSSAPSCGSGAFSANFRDLVHGTYSYTASCSGGRSWSGTVTLSTSCQAVKLE